jgi:hypothetical protein
MRDFRLPRSMRSDPGLLDAIHETIVGSDEFAGTPEIAGTTRGQRAVVALLLVDALVANGGFETVTDRGLLRDAREALEVVGAPEHRSLECQPLLGVAACGGHSRQPSTLVNARTTLPSTSALTRRLGGRRSTVSPVGDRGGILRCCR